MAKWKNYDRYGPPSEDHKPEAPQGYDFDATPRPTYAPPGGKHSPELSVGQILLKFWHRKGLILTTVLVCMAATAAILYQITPRYTAEAFIMIEGQRETVVNVEAVVAGLSGDTETIESEIEVIKSRPLVETTIKSLFLDQNAEYNKSLAKKGFFKKLIEGGFGLSELLPDGLIDAMSEQSGPAVPPSPESAIDGGVQTINAFLRNLSVRQKGRSRIIGVKFTSENPRTATSVANTLARLYIEQLIDLKLGATKQASNWLYKRVAILQKQVEKAEGKVERFREKSGLISARGVTITSQQVAELSTQVIIAKTERVETVARLRQIQSLLKSQQGAASAAEVLKSSLIQRFKEQESNFLRREAELSEVYGKRHPKIISIQAEINDIQGKIEQEVVKIIKGMKNEVEIARARETTLNQTLNTLKADLAKANKAEVKLRSLEREATASRALLETFMSRYKETSAQEDKDAQRADARILSLASLPQAPSYPKKKIILVFALLGSIGLGILLIFIVEMLDRGFRSSEQIENYLGIPVFGVVPLLSQKAIGRDQAANYILKNPVSPFSEAIRTVHTSLLLSQVDEPPKTILVTSSQPDEGKTIIAINLARMLAMAGRKILIIDCDFRHPNVGKVLEVDNEPGLVDLLAGVVDYNDVIKKDAASGAFVIPAGRPTTNPPSLLASEKMTQTLEYLEQTFDFIILDSPPVLAVSDARILARKVSGTVFVIRWADTSREMVQTAIKQLTENSTSLSGVILSMVDIKKNAKYGYGDAYHYKGRIKKYYYD